MEPVLRSLILRKFRSFPAEIVHFDNPTFLIGRNGSGKSNLGDALAFLSEAMSSPLQSVFERRGGLAFVRNRTVGKGYPRDLGLGVVLGNLTNQIQQARYAFEVRPTGRWGWHVLREQCVVHVQGGTMSWFDHRPRSFRSHPGGSKLALDPASLGLPVMAGESRFAPVWRTLAAMHSCSIEPAKMRDHQDMNSGTGMKSDGSNAANVLHEIGRSYPEDLERIGELLAAILPNTTVRPVRRGKKVTLEFTQKWGRSRPLKLDSLSMSDGTLRVLALLAAVYQRPAPAVLVIEEPEATIHPGALGVILDLLRHASRHMQVIVTTHSPEILDADWLEDRHLRVVTWQEGATRVLPLAQGAREALREHLMSAGEMFRSNALRPMMVPPGVVPETKLFEDVAA